MIEARKRWWLQRLFRHHARSRIIRRFGNVFVRGLNRLEAVNRAHPVLAVANHSSWWDGMLLITLCEGVLQCDAHVMMDAKNLRRFPFFSGLGAFGVDLESPRDGARAVRYARTKLDAPGRMVWIFPQGKEVPNHVRPLQFQGGAASVARGTDAVVMPTAFQYVFGPRERPDIYISVGPPVTETTPAAQARAVQRELERIDAALEAEGDHDFDVLHLGRKRSQGRSWAERLLGRATAVPQLSAATSRPVASTSSVRPRH